MAPPRDDSYEETRRVADALAEMAEHAMFEHHRSSPVLAAIAAAPSARPFRWAIRILIERLSADRRGVPDGSLLTRLICTSDLELETKLGFLRQLPKK